MWKYIVTWCFLELNPCDDPYQGGWEQKENCFFEYNNCEFKEEFTNRSNAVSFYNTAKRIQESKTYRIYGTWPINNVKIDSVLVKTEDQ